MSANLENVRLGKQEYEPSPKTLMMAAFFTDAVIHPPTFDFDKGRAAFPNNLWGNDSYGDCVIAGRMNQQLRIERVETKTTLKVTDDDAVRTYKLLSGCQTAGDAKDTGLSVLGALRDWRKKGWDLKSSTRGGIRHYNVDAFGELDVRDIEQQKAAIFLLHGAQFGYWLPRAAQPMTGNGVWDYKGETGPEWQPGSWGGHLVYSLGYNATGFTIKTWGMNVHVTDAFHKKYCDESWAVVDSLDSWRSHPEIDVVALEAKLQSIGASHVERG